MTQITSTYPPMAARTTATRSSEPSPRGIASIECSPRGIAIAYYGRFKEFARRIWALRKVCSVRLDSNRPFKAAALCPVTVASLLATLSAVNAGDANFAAVLSLGLAFWMRPNEWFFLDVECMAFVKMRGIELLHILFVISKGDDNSSGVVRRTAHRVGCGGTSTAPEIVLDGDGDFHGAFMCPVCYLAYHQRFNEIKTGPAFRARCNPCAPMRMNEVTKELRARLPAMNEGRAGGLERGRWRSSRSRNRVLRPSAATYADTIPNNSNTHTSFGAWSPVRAPDVQTGLPGESEWRGSRLALFCTFTYGSMFMFM